MPYLFTLFGRIKLKESTLIQHISLKTTCIKVLSYFQNGRAENPQHQLCLESTQQFLVAINNFIDTLENDDPLRTPIQHFLNAIVKKMPPSIQIYDQDTESTVGADSTTSSPHLLSLKDENWIELSQNIRTLLVHLYKVSFSFPSFYITALEPSLRPYFQDCIDTRKCDVPLDVSFKIHFLLGMRPDPWQPYATVIEARKIRSQYLDDLVVTTRYTGSPFSFSLAPRLPNTYLAALCLNARSEYLLWMFTYKIGFIETELEQALCFLNVLTHIQTITQYLLNWETTIKNIIFSKHGWDDTKLRECFINGFFQESSGMYTEKELYCFRSDVWQHAKIHETLVELLIVEDLLLFKHESNTTLWEHLSAHLNQNLNKIESLGHYLFFAEENPFQNLVHATHRYLSYSNKKSISDKLSPLPASELPDIADERTNFSFS